MEDIMRKVTTAALAAIILLTVSGCSVRGATDGGATQSTTEQSVAEACDIAEGAAQDAEDALSEALALVDDEDYTAASESIQSATDDLQAARGQVTNVRVRDELEDIDEDMREVGLLIDQLQAAADDAPLLAEVQSDLVDDSRDAQESIDELTALCG
ncbi:hypothetical protein NQ156_09345 [Microbacterium sp. zg.Y625]|uniref:hypothetical protein n=1 Tax=Microbacterium jiangjiandongii TaxID=3049071 RepID=UPI00214B61B0|nr:MULTISPECIES: hypothetical protein [unclassified Microbacterium]MCR2793262.1 hypothetical protein [Microbacterium sp. zg.Y625]WIM25361.1 hypothetical protein QNO14_14720 [Microbacterium sp. zg-Y625]